MVKVKETGVPKGLTSEIVRTPNAGWGLVAVMTNVVFKIEMYGLYSLNITGYIKSPF